MIQQMLHGARDNLVDVEVCCRLGCRFQLWRQQKVQCSEGPPSAGGVVRVSKRYMVGCRSSEGDRTADEGHCSSSSGAATYGSPVGVQRSSSTVTQEDMNLLYNPSHFH